jgi:hexulose-6-phosphate isomerase
MQGRLSPLVDGKIQAFPQQYWREEFASAKQLGFTLMEWTLDQEGLRQNPLLTNTGRHEIQRLAATHGVGVISVTGDCFMQAPFFKAAGERREKLLGDLDSVIAACGDLGATCLVVPVVDNGALSSDCEKMVLREELLRRRSLLSSLGLSIVFESDFPAVELKEFIDEFPIAHFGINYDIGNSAALGYDPREEFAAYGSRIFNVHVKDRVLGGTTVALGSGNADLPLVFSLLSEVGYRGNYILQTARARNDDHANVLRHYAEMVENLL